MVITRLGRGVDATRHFDPAALARTLEVIGSYADRCRALGVDAVRVVATSATRDVRNRDEVVAGVLARTGVEPEVLSGELEAAATWAGATAELPGGERTLVVDIGGGVTELDLGGAPPGRITGVPGRPATTPEAIVSLDIGCVRLTERHLHADPPTAAEVAGLPAEGRARRARLGQVS